LADCFNGVNTGRNVILAVVLQAGYTKDKLLGVLFRVSIGGCSEEKISAQRPALLAPPEVRRDTALLL
jgi:hypothetical protein